MYAWPWSVAYAFTLFVPVFILQLRAFDARRPLALPPRSWCVLALGAVIVVLASALQSPYRGSSLLWAALPLSAVAVFLVVFDWLQSEPDESEARRTRLLSFTGLFFAVVALTSMGLWTLNLSPSLTASQVLAGRNPFPLGHSSYTAGLALLMLPCFGTLAWRAHGAVRAGWLGGGLLALAMLFTGGSRGGLVGLAALLIVFTPAVAHVLRIRLWLVILVGLMVLGVLLQWNPRLRAMVAREPAGAGPNLSNLQRTAMFTAGLRMGTDRPLLGWGPGATPLAYPRYRAGLDGGAENVLQLHSTPVQLWAELGAGGVTVAVALLALALHAARVSPRARFVFLALSGYAVFSLTDWQLDVPVYAFALAISAAWLAPGAEQTSPALRPVLGTVMLTALALVALLGRRDPAPELILRALTLAHDPAQADRAVALLHESLTLNPDQEIAHFNLGWLQIVRDPAAAEEHFLAAARLVPDKGGVYFGLGLARLNQGQRDRAARAFALEGLNDPLFLTSPWWRVAPVSELRAATNNIVMRMADAVARAATSREPRIANEARYTTVLVAWLQGRIAPGEMLAHSLTSERVSYFARRPSLPAFETAPIRTYRRERTGYPVLMRNLDLPIPTDLFDVQENFLAAGELRFLFPPKGWLPSPLLLALLEEPVSTKP